MDRSAILGRILRDAAITEPEAWQEMERAGEFDGNFLEVCALLAYVKRSFIDDQGSWFEGVLSRIERRPKPDYADAAYLTVAESRVDRAALSAVVKDMQFQVLWSLVAALHDGAGSDPIRELPNKWFGLCFGTYNENFDIEGLTPLPQHIHPILRDFFFDRSI